MRTYEKTLIEITMCSDNIGYLFLILIGISYVCAFMLQDSIILSVKDVNENLYKEFLGDKVTLFETDSLGGTDWLLFGRFLKFLPKAAELNPIMQGMCRLYKFFAYLFLTSIILGSVLWISCKV